MGVKANVEVILENAPGVVLDREEIYVGPDDDVHEKIGAVLEDWLVSVGDTIKVREIV